VHAKTVKINRDLIAGATYRNIAKQYRISITAIVRHKSHIAKAIARHEANAESKEVAQAGTLLDRLRDVHRVTSEVLSEARESNDNTTALRAIARLEKQIELEARLLGELKDVAPAPPPPIDLSRLSDEDLSHLEVVIERATIRSRSDSQLPVGKPIVEVSQKA